MFFFLFSAMKEVNDWTHSSFQSATTKKIYIVLFKSQIESSKKKITK